MNTTFGQRLKYFRKLKKFTQQELAELIGVSTQAISKWETNTGMPDISQIVPLSQALHVSTDSLLGISDDYLNDEFEKVLNECLALEAMNPAQWPPAPEIGEQGYRIMYEYFSKHPYHVRAAKYLLDITELYWGQFPNFTDQNAMLKECERFANCIICYGDDADIQAEARFLLSSVLTRVGDFTRAISILEKLPFEYGDRYYRSAEIAKIANKSHMAENFGKESFTNQARYLIKNVSLVASLPNKTIQQQIAYKEYMLRIIDALLSGGDVLPYEQVYQKLMLLTNLMELYAQTGRFELAKNRFSELNHLCKEYYKTLKTAPVGESLMLLDNRISVFGNNDTITPRKQLIESCLSRAMKIADAHIELKSLTDIP
ncbi:MAG: helix-turn-helix transcriptional regulator [Clostridia bacterium]|nr:helix-turn-helix transcriptional regulator [Clostridia bacterium]